MEEVSPLSTHTKKFAPSKRLTTGTVSARRLYDGSIQKVYLGLRQETSFSQSGHGVSNPWGLVVLSEWLWFFHPGVERPPGMAGGNSPCAAPQQDIPGQVA